MSELSFSEHTEEKLDALKYYYNLWFNIVKGQRCYIIDCNAGKGFVKIKNTRKKLLGSSLLAVELFKKDIDQNLTLYLIEKDGENSNILRKNIEEFIKDYNIPAEVDADIIIINEDWTSVIDEIINDTDDGIRLFLLDPYAIKSIPWTNLLSLIKRGKSEFGYKESGIEVLINWAWHAIRRKIGKYYSQNSTKVNNIDKSIQGELKILDNFFGPVKWKDIADNYPNQIFKKKIDNNIDELRNNLASEYVKHFFKYFRYVKIHSVHSRKKDKDEYLKKRGKLKYFLIFASNYQPALDIIDAKFKEYRDKKFYTLLPKTQKTLTEFIPGLTNKSKYPFERLPNIKDKIKQLELELGIQFFKVSKKIIKFLYYRKNYDYGCFDFGLFNEFDINENKYLPYLKEKNVIDIRLKKSKKDYIGNYYYLCHPILVDRNDYLFFDEKRFLFDKGNLKRF